MVPQTEDMRYENWVGRSASQHVATLQAMENDLAAREGRNACAVGLIPGKDRELEDGEAVLRGRYIPGEEGGQIQLDPSLLASDEPYRAAETYFHEARHAYQDYAVQHPEIHGKPDEVNEWRMNRVGYIGSEDLDANPMLNYAHYRFQPLEDDANRVGRERAEELYGGTFKDYGRYPDYRACRQRELDDDVAYAQATLGEDYIEQARQAMQSKYDFEMAQEQDHLKALGRGESASPAREEPQPSEGVGRQSTPADSGNASAAPDEDEDEGYYLGYSY